VDNHNRWVSGERLGIFLCSFLALTKNGCSNYRIEADLGRFSEAIYKKITADAKKQQFQGFRPGTIPAHLLPTYRAFAMDECARETVLEAMQQNNIRPFSEARTQLTIENCCIPPPSKKATKKKKSGRKSKGEVDEEEPEIQVEPQWLQFENMKGAIDAGWQVRDIQDY
jgi:FKBP-type peptidyl-prolyl cis-trans isomerase (trigger factor)